MDLFPLDTRAAAAVSEPTEFHVGRNGPENDSAVVRLFTKHREEFRDRDITMKNATTPELGSICIASLFNRNIARLAYISITNYLPF